MRQTLYNLAQPIHVFSSSYTPLVDGAGDIVYGGGSVALSSLDLLVLRINNDPPAPNNQVMLSDVRLTTSSGSTYSIVNNSGGTTSMSFAPAIGSSIEVAFSWPDDGSTIADAFRIDARMQLLAGDLGGMPLVDVLLATCGAGRIACEFTTIDNLGYSSNLYENDLLITNNVFVVTDNGALYTVTSFVVDGNDLLGGTPFQYGILNLTDHGGTPLPSPHAALQFTGSNSENYLGNYPYIFAGLFAHVGLSPADWTAYLAPDDGTEASWPDIVTIAYPSTIQTWTITIVRADGVEYEMTNVGARVYRTDGSWESDETSYQYGCVGLPPPLVGISQVCEYSSWDSTDVVRGTNNLPINMAVLFFSTDNYALFSGTYANPPITSPAEFTFNTLGDSFYNNNSTFLNAFFQSIGVENDFIAATLDDRLFELQYPASLAVFLLVVQRNNGDLYYYTPNGVTMSNQGYNSQMQGYSGVCTTLGNNGGRLQGRQMSGNSSGIEEQQRRAALKAAKDATPLSVPTPVTNADIVGLLRERIDWVAAQLVATLGVDRSAFGLYLFGSQISGNSSSGAPDIDLWVVPADSSTTVITRAALAAVVDAATFKVDLTPSSASVVQRRVNIPLQ